MGPEDHNRIIDAIKAYIDLRLAPILGDLLGNRNTLYQTGPMQQQERPEDYGKVTQAELDRAVKNIKDHIDLKVDPLSEELRGHDHTLFGRDGRGGLTADVNTIKGDVKMVKSEVEENRFWIRRVKMLAWGWLAGLGGLSPVYWEKIKNFFKIGN